MSPAPFPAGLVLIGLVVVQRLAELALARRNTRRLLARGGCEVGAAHYRLIVGLHVGWIATLLAFGWHAALSLPFAGLYLLLQAFRIWVITSLGGRWTTRIILIDAPPTRRGPYRFMRHPNYLLVAGEIAVVPLALGLPWLALGFLLLDAAAMAIRIPAENRALAAQAAGGCNR